MARNSAAPIARGATDCDTVHIRADGSALWFICGNQPPIASILTQAPARALLARASDYPGASARNRILPCCSLRGDGGLVSTVIENLLARKQKLVEELEMAQTVEDRDRIEHQLEQINTALDFLDRPGPEDGR